MSDSHDMTENILIQEPEELDPNRVGQPTVISRAKAFHSALTQFGTTKEKVHSKGLVFGGRVLLIGNPGTDFEAFAHHVAYEMPMNLIRLRIEQSLGDTQQMTNSLRTLIEVAKRNSPAIIYLDKVDVIARKDTEHASSFMDILKESLWDNDEILIVGATLHPERIEEGVLSIFDRVYLFEPPTYEERKTIIEQLLGERKDLDPALVSELTEGWGFSDILHLATAFLTDVPQETKPYSRTELEKMLQSIGIVALTRKETREYINITAKGSHIPAYPTVDAQFPDDFLDQLYLLAVGDDFQQTQRVIETLNGSLPLTRGDSEFLSRYPFLLTGNPEDRLTRLMRAKRTRDRLSRLMGR